MTILYKYKCIHICHYLVELAEEQILHIRQTPRMGFDGAVLVWATDKPPIVLQLESKQRLSDFKGFGVQNSI